MVPMPYYQPLVVILKHGFLPYKIWEMINGKLMVWCQLMVEADMFYMKQIFYVRK